MSDQGTTSDVFQGNTDDLFEGFFPEGESEAEQTEAPPETRPAEPETPETTEGEQEQPEEAPAEPETQPSAEEETEPEAEAPAEEQPLLGGKFKTPEDAVTAFQNAERLATQRAQEAAQLRREREQIVTALRNAEPVLRKAMELQGQQEPNIEELIQSGELDASDPRVIQELVRRESQREAQKMVQAQLAPIQEQQEQQRVQQGLGEIQAFRQSHPDAAPHEPTIAQIVEEYRYDDETSEEIFPPTKDNLETALTLATNPQAHGLLQALNLHPEKEWVQYAVEAASSPALQQVVLAHPHVIESEAGMNWARQQANLPAVVRSAQTNATQAQQQQTEDERKAAFVEKGEGSQTDLAPGKKPRDPLEEAFFDAVSGDAKGAVFR